MKMTPFYGGRVPAILAAAAFLPLIPLPTSSLSAAEDVAHEDADLRLYVMGNSLTDELSYENFLKMAKAGGKDIALGSVRVPGAPIGWLLQHNMEKGGFTHRPYGNPNKAWSEWKWDALTLQPFQWSYDKNTVHSKELMLKLYENSPDAQVYIYAQWPYNTGRDWERAWLTPREEEIMTREEHEDTVIWLRENVEQGNPVKLIPAGHVMHVLEQKIRAGQVPGLESMWEAYSDGVHVNNLGNLIVAGTYYSTLFGESPEGLPFDMFTGPDQKIDITAELGKIVQESIWQVVATHPMTGVTSDKPIEIVTPQVSDAVVNSQYKMELLPAFGKAPRVWSLKSGDLPAGVELQEDGRITGIPLATGMFEFTAMVKGAEGSSAEKSYALQVVEDTAPEIKGPLEITLLQGGYISADITAESNNPPLLWSMAEEDADKLPKGVQLTRDGLLQGCTGHVGSFEAPIKVEDGDSREPESDSATLKIDVRPSEDIKPARKFQKAPEIDGKLEGDPWQFETPVDKVLAGEPQGKVFVDYGWDDEKFYVAVLVEDDSLIGSQWNFEEGMDAVRVFLDGQNNREETYNWDDFIYALNPKGGNDNQGRTFRTSSKAGEVEGGYLVEIAVPFGNLGYRIVSKEKKEPTWLCVGLDVMVTDIDEKGGEPVSQVIWKGTEENLTNPSQFQTLIMSPDEG